MEPRPDAELLRAWQGGDPSAGQELVRRHAPRITRFFRNKVSAPVEDLVQDTFLALLEGHQRIDQPDKLPHYLYGIAHNVLRAYIRSSIKARQIDEGASSMAALDPGPTSIIARRREHRLLLQALRRIPIQHQIALELYYWEGLNTVDIAAILGLSASAMRSRMGRARELLERELELLAESTAELESTVGGLDNWVAGIRQQMATDEALPS
ncbi:RNA polymerase sigma factor [Enhygromyxa salina]|uniref:ECF RNA polymerase sigma factor SigE n=1 Tax=Enhygromyxa salina TaxID=215803 RepID=A0A2S9YTG9_9BACT|nr:sigma-70 family RNA polymerase sigma factor [Enhygromyxa salina]PRQ08384.1 ECF RNA polymerase sigma factor SigE [Enhygromyxa salina]